jgi:raffinose/stachyose/melibiose transport system substrate-binding protein
MTPLFESRHRRSAAVAVPMVAGLLLAACGSSDSGGSGGAEPQTITFSYAAASTTEDAYDTLAKDYMAAHPGVTVKTNRVALDAYNSSLSTQMQAGNGPDVMYVNSGTGQSGSVGQLGKAGLLMELKDSSLSAVLPEGDAPLYSVNDKLYGVPTSLAVSSVIWNPDGAKGSGIELTADSSLADVTAKCGTVHDAGKSVYGLAGSVPQNTGILSMIIASSLVYGDTPDWNEQRAAGKTTFAETQAWKDTLQEVKDLYDAKCFQDGAAGAGFDTLTNGASSGNLFGFFAPSGAAKDIMDAAGGHVSLVTLPVPVAEGKKNYLALTSNIGLSGNAKTKSPKLVEDFIKFAVSPEESQKFASTQGTIPVGEDIDTSKLLPQYQPIAQLLADKQYRPFGIDSWPNGQVYDALGTGVTGLLTGQKSVDDVLKAMDSAWGN